MRISRGGSFLFRILGRLESTSVSTGLSEGLLCGLARIEDFIFTTAYRFTGRWYSPMANANEPVTDRGQLRISVCSVVRGKMFEDDERWNYLDRSCRARCASELRTRSLTIPSVYLFLGVIIQLRRNREGQGTGQVISSSFVDEGTESRGRSSVTENVLLRVKLYI